MEPFEFKTGAQACAAKREKVVGTLGSSFTAYIDESGEPGISKIRDSLNNHGASPYFVLGAVVCQPTAEVYAKNSLERFKEDIGKTRWKHATDLTHSEKVYLGRELGRLPVRYFAVISNKKTLKGYKGQIESDAQKFYNKCLKYLLELICGYIGPHISNAEDFSVVLEKRNHDYDRMIRYLSAVKKKPIYLQSNALRNLNPFAISTRAKGEEDMVEIADFVAHAVYQLTNRSKSNFGIPEPRYFTELSSRFSGDSNNRVLGTGIKCIHDLDSLQLDLDIVQTIRKLRVKAPADRSSR